MKKYFLYQDYGNENNAGPKAKNDVNKILDKKDFRGISFKIPSNQYIRPLVAKHIWKKRLRNLNNSLVICQYPFYSHVIEKSLVREIIFQRKKYKDNKYVAFIHDIESLRQNPDDKEHIDRELNILNEFDVLVCHNLCMKQWLIENGITSKIYILNLFDYLSKSKFEINNQTNINYKVLNFAGNLKKANFLREPFTVLDINIYGPNYDKNFNRKNYHYKGEFSPEEIPDHINNGFGLIWDGKNSKSPTGAYGNYLRYITPHKFSLYLRSGVPVIAWKDSAIASYIEDNSLGFVIESLDEIDQLISNMTYEKYVEMKNNCLEFSQKLGNGFFTKQVLKKIETES